MKKKRLVFFAYVIALAVNFYLLPFLIVDTGSAMLMMLVVIPVITLVLSVVHGILCGFWILLPVIATALFAPTIFIHYNSSAWVYILNYAGLAFAGNGIGSLLSRKQRTRKREEK